MADENSFDADWNLLSKVLRAGRAETAALSEDAMARVLEAYRQGAAERRIEPHLNFTNEDIRSLTTEDVKKLLTSDQIQSINGIEHPYLKKRFEEVLNISDANLAAHAVKDELERTPANQARVEDSLKRVRESLTQQEEAVENKNVLGAKLRRD